MKKSVMQKWVKALRSGKYKQGKHQLRDSDNNYCCLGVLCEISGKKYDGEDLFEPHEVASFAGFKDLGTHYLKKGYKTRQGKAHSLVELNDWGLSFKQIANIIEKNYKDL